MDEHAEDRIEHDDARDARSGSRSGGPAGAAQDARSRDGRIRRIVRVRGRVQGVGYRMDAAGTARRLGVHGTVRNLLDGTVEAAIEGPPSAIEVMIDHLREGPGSARVDGIDVRRESPRGIEGFRVTG